MSKIESIQETINSDFFAPERNMLIENRPGGVMSIPIQADGVPYVSYKFDVDLSGYRGGLFPFFSQKDGVRRISDYILFAERNNRIYGIMIELKKGKTDSIEQLEASKCLADYIIKTTFRVTKGTFDSRLRCITISEFHRIKKGTKEKPVQYINDHAEFKGRTLKLKAFLV